MKFTRLLVLAILVVATIIACVACNDSSDKKTSKPDDKPTDTVKDECPNGGDHDWIEYVKREPTCTMQGQKGKKCSKCGEEGRLATSDSRIPATDHDYGDLLTVPSTCLAPGKDYRVCKICGDEKLEKELPLADHNYSVEVSKNGKFELKNCPNCGTEFIKNITTKNDYFDFHFDEISFEPSALSTFNPDFSFQENGFDPYKGADSTNTVAAMKDNALNCAIRIEDKNLQLKELPAYVIQFDVMLTQYPENLVNSFVTLEYGYTDDNGEAKIGYSNFLFLRDDGYLGICGEDTWRDPIEGTKLELNQWYNIAVVVRDHYVNDDPDDTNPNRIRYDLYINNKKIELKTQIPKKDANGNPMTDPITGNPIMEDYTAPEGAAAYEYSKMSTGYTIRISDGGYGDGDTNQRSHGRMALDNILIYGGKDVKPAIRGEIDFEKAGKKTITYPTEIKEEEFN